MKLFAVLLLVVFAAGCRPKPNTPAADPKPQPDARGAYTGQPPINIGGVPQRPRRNVVPFLVSDPFRKRFVPNPNGGPGFWVSDPEPTRVVPVDVAPMGM